MKSKKNLWFLFLFTILFSMVLQMFLLPAYAQVTNDPLVVVPPITAPDTGINWQVLVLSILPLLVPILVTGVKTLLTKVPTWMLPILAPALGAVIDLISAKIGGFGASPILAAALGSAGVGLREIKDQVQQRIQNKGPLPPTVVGLLLLGALSFGFVGCKSVNPTTGQPEYNPALTQQVKDALEPAVRLPVRRVIMNSPQHSAEIATYFRGIAQVFCKMKEDKSFNPTTLTANLQSILPPKLTNKEAVQTLLDLKVSVESLYKIYWNDRFSAELPEEGWMYNVADFFCSAIDNGLKDAGQAGAK